MKDSTKGKKEMEDEDFGYFDAISDIDEWETEQVFQDEQRENWEEFEAPGGPDTFEAEGEFFEYE